MNVTAAKVVAVNVLEYSVDVMTEDTHQPLIGVPIMTPLSHPDHMGGINLLPEPGAKCWICTPAEPTSAFVLGFMWNSDTDRQAREYNGPGPNFTGGRDPLEPGDICLATVDGNQVVVRRGGIVQIGSTSLAQRLYIPVGNVIRDFFQRYDAVSPLGEIHLSHARLEPGASFSSGVTPVSIHYDFKRTLQEDLTGGAPYSMELRFGVLSPPKEGSVNTPDTAVSANHIFANKGLSTMDGAGLAKNSEGQLSLTFYSPGGKKVVYAFQVGVNGDQFLMSQGHIHVESMQKIYLGAKEGIVLEAKGGKQVIIRTSDTGEILLGGDLAAHPALLGDSTNDLLKAVLGALMTHTHTVFGVPSTPPVTGLDVFTAQKAIAESGALLSQIVKIRS